jgi:menaquinol-cytochrome c reductase iron-sulfur subunit
MKRRDVLTLLVLGGSATTGLVVGVPTLLFAIAPGRDERRKPIWRDVLPIEEFPIGQITASVVQPAQTTPSSSQFNKTKTTTVLSGIYVWRISDVEVVVFSRSCTDLGCPLNFDRGSECFLCPCHGGIFSKQGEPMAGPPDRPLYRYETRIENGVLQVNLSSVPPMV